MNLPSSVSFELQLSSSNVRNLGNVLLYISRKVFKERVHDSCKKFPSKINWKWIPENFKCLWNKFFLNFWIKSNRNWFKKICPKIPQIPLEIICYLRLFSQSSSKDDEYARRQAIPLINSIGCEKGKYPDNWKRNIPIQIRCDQDSAQKKRMWCFPRIIEEINGLRKKIQSIRAPTHIIQNTRKGKTKDNIQKIDAVLFFPPECQVGAEKIYKIKIAEHRRPGQFTRTSMADALYSLPFIIIKWTLWYSFLFCVRKMKGYAPYYTLPRAMSFLSLWNNRKSFFVFM